VAALHMQLLEQHKDLQALEGHLRQLHTELRLLGTVGLAACGAGGAAGGSGASSASSSRPGSPSLLAHQRPPSAAAGSVGASLSALQAARAEHDAAAAELAQHNSACLELQRQTASVQASHQQLLVSVCVCLCEHAHGMRTWAWGRGSRLNMLCCRVLCWHARLCRHS
jgi:hypothetical protein